ncbi:MAG: rod shape-determining protein MreC [Desulfobacterales bacterium]|nr:rod shape-determining protein MreC [Desulfobacterales bacterium]
MLIIIAGFILIVVNIMGIAVSLKAKNYSIGGDRVTLYLIGPLQESVNYFIQSMRNIWNHYFFITSVAKENDRLLKALNNERQKSNECKELFLENSRLNNLLNFQKGLSSQVIAAEVIGRDPSPWFKTIIINKGAANGLKKGLPVMVSEGIVGQLIDISKHYSRVMLIIDHNSAVDALIQRNRTRGIVKGGEENGNCFLKYVLRKYEVSIGDVVVSSGLDSVFPKGSLIGNVSKIVKTGSGIFQEVIITPYVDFDKLEEVLIILNPSKVEFEIKK